MKNNLILYNKQLVSARRSKKHLSIQRGLGIGPERINFKGERRQERYKKVGEKMRSVYDESRGFRNGRKIKRRRKRK